MSGDSADHFNLSDNRERRCYEMGIIVAYGIILCVYAVCPFLIQITGFAINAFVPDPIPFLDEFIMIVCMFSKLEKIMDFFEAVGDFISDIGDYISEHRIAFIISGIVCAGLIVWIIWAVNS